MAARNTKAGYTISGPGVDKAGYETGGVGLSAATTFAREIPDGESIYVRDEAGAIYGRVDRVDDRNFRIWREGNR